jgi:hypothetical protein
MVAADVVNDNGIDRRGRQTADEPRDPPLRF